MMDSWIWQPGYPLVSASIVDDTLVLRQQRFLFDASSATPSTRRGPSPSHPSRRHHHDAAPRHRDRTPRSVGLARFRGDRQRRGARLLPGRLLRRAPRADRRHDAAHPLHAGALQPGRRCMVGHRRRRDVGGAAAQLLHGFVEEDEHVVGRRSRSRRGVWVGCSTMGRSSTRSDPPRDLTTPALVALGEPSDDESDLYRKLRGLLVSTAGVLGNDVEVQARCLSGSRLRVAIRLRSAGADFGSDQRGGGHRRRFHL